MAESLAVNGISDDTLAAPTTSTPQTTEFAFPAASARLPMRVLVASADFSKAALRLYLALAAHCFGDRYVCWPGTTRLAEICGKGTNLRRARIELQKAGVIRYTPANGRQRAVYELPDLASTGDKVSPVDRGQGDTPTVDRVTRNCRQGDTQNPVKKIERESARARVVTGQEDPPPATAQRTAGPELGDGDVTVGAVWAERERLRSAPVPDEEERQQVGELAATLRARLEAETRNRRLAKVRRMTDGGDRSATGSGDAEGGATEATPEVARSVPRVAELGDASGLGRVDGGRAGGDPQTAGAGPGPSLGGVELRGEVPRMEGQDHPLGGGGGAAAEAAAREEVEESG